MIEIMITGLVNATYAEAGYIEKSLKGAIQHLESVGYLPELNEGEVDCFILEERPRPGLGDKINVKITWLDSREIKLPFNVTSRIGRTIRDALPKDSLKRLLCVKLVQGGILLQTQIFEPEVVNPAQATT